MSQDIPVTGYAILGLLTFGDELTGYEIKQRADITLRFYWVSPAMSQIYTELRRLLTERLGYEAAINYRTEPLDARLPEDEAGASTDSIVTDRVDTTATTPDGDAAASPAADAAATPAPQP